MADDVRQIVLRDGTSEEWAASGTVLALGEMGFDSTTKRVKVGDGVTGWAALGWSTMAGGEVQRLLDAADRIEAAGTPVDAAMAVELAKPDSASRAELTRTIAEAVAAGGIAGPLKKFPLVAFLNEGEVMPNDNVADASALLQRAIDGAYAWRVENGAAFRAGGIPAQIEVGGGGFKVLNALMPRSGVGIAGAGADVTVFYPYGNQCFMKGPLYSAEPVGGWEATMLDDMLFEDFSVDCINQSNGSYDGAIKAFFMQNLRRARFHRVKGYNSWASMFGVDFLVDCEFTDCYGFRAGRGGPADVVGTGSIFAYGTGRFDNESIRWTNCLAEEAAAGGWFLERIDFRQAKLQSPGFTMVNCRAVRNSVGMLDTGSGGVKAIGCDFAFNKNAGWYTGSGGVSPVGGRDGLISGCTFYKNGGATTGSIIGGHAIMFGRNNSIGGYMITGNQFIENAGDAILIETDTIPSHGGLKVRGNTFRRNARGLHIQRMRTRLIGLEVEGNLFDSQTIAAIQFDDDLLAPAILANTFMGSGQPVSVKFAAGRTVTNPMVQRNTFVDQPVPFEGLDVLDHALVKDNSVVEAIEFTLKKIAGASPIYTIAGTSGVLRNDTETSFTVAQPTTTYLVADTAPAANRRLQIRTAASAVQLDIGRNSGNTSWVALARNSAGANQFAEIAAASQAAVLAVVRTENEVLLSVAGLTDSAVAVTGWSNSPLITNVQRQIGFAYAVTFAGAHTSTQREQILAALSTYFGVAPYPPAEGDGLSGTPVNGVAASDAFTRTSADLVGTSPSVGRRPWGGAPGRIEVNGTRAVSKGVDQGLVILDVAATGSYDVACVMRVSTQESVAKAARVYGKYIDGNNGLYLSVSGSTSASVSLRVVAGGTQRVLSSFTATTIPANTAAADYGVRIVQDGLNVTATVNGVTRTATLTEAEAAALQSAQRVAIMGDSTNHQWDDLIIDVNGTYV